MFSVSPTLSPEARNYEIDYRIQQLEESLSSIDQRIKLIESKIIKREKHIHRLECIAQHCREGDRPKRVTHHMLIDLHKEEVIQYKKCLEQLRESEIVSGENLRRLRERRPTRLPFA